MENNFEQINEQIKEVQSQLAELIAEKNKQVNTKPMGKYHDIYLLLIGFMLTALVGGFISYFYQKKMYDYQKQAIFYENNQHEKIEFYKKVSEIITTRYLYARRVITAIEENKSAEIVLGFKDKYYESIDEWSKNDAYNRAFLHNSFKDSLVYKKYTNVGACFTGSLHKKIRQLLSNETGTTNFAEIDNLLAQQDNANKEFFTLCSSYVYDENPD